MATIVATKETISEVTALRLSTRIPTLMALIAGWPTPSQTRSTSYTGAWLPSLDIATKSDSRVERLRQVIETAAEASPLLLVRKEIMTKAKSGSAMIAGQYWLSPSRLFTTEGAVARCEAVSVNNWSLSNSCVAAWLRFAFGRFLPFEN